MFLCIHHAQVPVEWDVGDLIVLPSTGDFTTQNQNEVHTIKTVSADKKVLTLKGTLKVSSMRCFFVCVWLFYLYILIKNNVII